jgi:hypothetical protein
MSQVFGPWANTVAKLSIVLGVFSVAGGLALLDVVHRSAYVRYTGVARSQPIPFSHKHHANMGIDCRYCHTSVEEEASANIPPTSVCMNCHTMVWADSEVIQPIHESWETGEPIEWTRVHDLPDFVYFNHAAHVNKGIGCATCHGRVDEMPLIWKEEPLYMKWCLECHREPELFVRPQEEIFNMAYELPVNQAEVGAALVEEYDIKTYNHRLTDCWICHR